MEKAKELMDKYVDKKVVVSVIAAGAVLALIAYGAKKAGISSVSKAVAAVK